MIKKQFGKSLKKTFSVKRATRGGNTNAFEKKREQPLVGKVQDKSAAQGEERLARALDKRLKAGTVQEYKFRWTTEPMWTARGRELDFLIKGMRGSIAVSVKGADFVHLTAGAKERDRVSELLIMAKLRKIGIQVPEIKTVYDYELGTQELADKVVEKLGL